VLAGLVLGDVASPTPDAKAAFDKAKAVIGVQK
jgi:hypothetical protein